MASEATRSRRTTGTDTARALIAGAKLASERVAALPRRTVVLTLICAQWLLLAVLAVRAAHDGWTWDPTHVPSGAAASLLPEIVLVQTLILLPLALVVVYALAESLAGRTFAAWAGALWVVLPYAGYAYSDPSFRTVYRDRFLVHVTGLSADPHFAALVLFGFAFVLAARAATTGSQAQTAGAVAAAGPAVALVPRAATVAIALPVALLAAGRRGRALEAAAGLAIILGAVGSAIHAGWLHGPLGTLGYSAPHTAAISLQESFWSGSLLEFLTMGGLLALFRGKRMVAILLSTATVFAFLSVRAGANATSIHVALLQDVLPAWFAIVLAVAALPLLIPGLGTAGRPAGEVIADWRFRLRAHAFPRRAAEAGDDAGAMPLWIAVAIGCVLVFIAFVGIWNAARYPYLLGYDATEHMTYAYQLIHTGTIPQQSQGGEFYTPPGYYAVAGAAVWVASHLGMASTQGFVSGTLWPYQAAQYLNVGFLLGTALLVVVLARLLFPRRPVVALAAVSFLALVPAVTRAAAMFYPETLNMLVSTACLTLATWMLVRRRFQLRWAAALAVLLAIGQLVRASAIFTSVSIAIALAAALASREYRRQMPLRRLGLAVAVLALLVTPWYVRQARNHISIAQSVSSESFFHPGGGSLPFFQLRAQALLLTPYRPHLTNAAAPQFYADLWGDWIGAFAWSSYSEAPTSAAARLMRDQMRLGLIPTLLALGGWVGLVVIAVRRRLDGIPLIAVVLLPLLAVGADFYRAYSIPTPDGSLLKPTYALTSAPVWALCFGLAVDWLARRRVLAIAAVLAILVLGGLELRFILYGIRNHHPIF